MAATRVRLYAWVLAVATEAGQFAWAIRIHGTLGTVLLYNNLALGVRVAAISRRAAARGNVVVNAAFGVQSAIARVLALLISARQSVRAVVVHSAFWAVAAN